MLELDIQMFAGRPKLVIDTELNSKNFENGLNKMQNTAKGAGASIKNIVAGLGITKLISMAMSEISSSIDGAVKRIDTFNAYPKVLKNFGVSADEAQKSISRIDKSVRGLPTSLDQAVGGVQNLFMVTKDLGQAEKLFKAINDSAMVFANGSTEAVDRFSYAFKQAMSSGKVSAQDFNQMNEAIPGLMDKVAESMGINYATLKEGLSDGSISMEQFNNALTKLDTEGGAGMSALEKVAKTSTGGIATSVTNMKTAITRGAADMIKKLDEGLKDFGGLSGVISSLGKLAESALKKIGQYLPTIIKSLKKILPILTPIFAAIAAFTIVLIIKDVIAALSALFALILANPIGLIVAAIAALVTGFVMLWNKSEAFRNFWIGLWNGIVEFMSPIIDSIVEMFQSAWELIKVVWGYVGPYFKQIFENIKIIVKTVKNVLIDVFSGAWEGIKTAWSVAGTYFKTVFDTITGIFKAIKAVLSGDFRGAWEAIKGVFSGWSVYFRKLFNSIVKIFSTIGSKFLSIGKNIVAGIWAGISGSLSWIKNRITGWVGNVVKFIKKVFKIGSPSKLTRDEVGVFVAQGIGVGFEEELDNVYKGMQKAINFETGKMQASVQTGKVFNTLANTTPVHIELNADVEMDKTKVGRIVTPVVSETLKTGGLR